MLFLMLAVIAVAQEPTFRVQSNVVTVPILIKDDKGNVVYGLHAKDFIIEDDGTEQVAQLDEAAEAEPISMVVALQRGRRARREFPRMRGLSSLLSPIFGQPESQVALVEFDSTVRLTQAFTHNSEEIEGDLGRLEAGDESAAILDAVQYSVDLLDEAPKDHQRVLVLISETRDHGSRFTKIKDVVAATGRSNTVVYALPFSPGISQVLDTERGRNKDEWGGSPDLLAPLIMASHAMRKNTAKAIAGMTGGEYEMFTSRKGFERLMTDFPNHLHSRYLLSFEPKNPHPGLHEIRVRSKEPRARTILARGTYWAKETPQ
jgi:VWFA-related protein